MIYLRSHEHFISLLLTQPYRQILGPIEARKSKNTWIFKYEKKEGLLFFFYLQNQKEVCCSTFRWRRSDERWRRIHRTCCCRSRVLWWQQIVPPKEEKRIKPSRKKNTGSEVIVHISRHLFGWGQDVKFDWLESLVVVSVKGAAIVQWCHMEGAELLHRVTCYKTFWN